MKIFIVFLATMVVGCSTNNHHISLYGETEGLSIESVACAYGIMDKEYFDRGTIFSTSMPLCFPCTALIEDETVTFIESPFLYNLGLHVRASAFNVYYEGKYDGEFYLKKDGQGAESWVLVPEISSRKCGELVEGYEISNTNFRRADDGVSVELVK